jgi:hypothetical protein
MGVKHRVSGVGYRVLSVRRWALGVGRVSPCHLVTLSPCHLVILSSCFLLLTGGCAKAPSGASTGRRLAVTMQFQGPINANYQYFFVIRNANDASDQNGPVPVTNFPYGGNGFAFGPTSNGPAFTDFVVFGGGRGFGSTGYGIYHVQNALAFPNNPAVPSTFVARGEPVFTTPSTGSNANTLYFEIDLSQIAPLSNEALPTNGTDTRPQNLQVNLIVATSTPANTTVDDTSRVTDAMGDQSSQSSGSFNRFLHIDTNVSRTYTSRDAVSNLDEREGDTFSLGGAYDPGIDLIYWSIQVK